VKIKEQAWYIIGAIILLAGLYFGFDINPSSQKALEKSRALNVQEYDITTYQAEAKKGLGQEDIRYLETLETQFQHAGEDSTRISLLKQLSGQWYSLNNPIMAGLYAREVAEKENTGESWSITGTTFASGLTGEFDEKQKSFLRDQAIEAFEKAISLEPEEVDHRVNQALCYVEMPEAGEPMKGIQMLAGLATSHPESPAPPYHLARLAVRTGQYERGLARIEKALELAPEDQRVACLAIEIYTALNKTEEAGKLADRCAGKK
jgi:tetratricopeptide (TPR) repeat protein